VLHLRETFNPQKGKTMTQRYNVHVYREMRLYFQDIKAVSPQQAAEACAEFPCDEAAGAALDCDGETFSALVDVQGDLDYSQSVTVDFQSERMRKAAPQLLAALQEAVAEIELLRADLLHDEESRAHQSSSSWARVYDKAIAAIATANAG
jgi:hypothetical protein